MNESTTTPEQPSAESCGRPWVAEIELCPRCKLSADKHPPSRV